MIDIHTHLLNGVDDGAENTIESLTNLKLAQEAGFTDIILTPHYIEDYYENDYQSTKIKIEELKSKLYDNNISIKLYQGNEVYISDSIGKLIQNNIVSNLAGSKYLLFELPQKNKILNLDNLIMEIKYSGCIPVLAHPERYTFIQQNPNEIARLISKGVLIQSNYGSIIGQYGKEANKTIIKLLKNNMVHFLGSDTHKNGHIYSNFNHIKKELLKYINEYKLLELTTNNAMHILNDDVIKIQEPTLIKKNWFFT